MISVLNVNKYSLGYFYSKQDLESKSCFFSSRNLKKYYLQIFTANIIKLF